MITITTEDTDFGEPKGPVFCLGRANSRDFEIFEAGLSMAASYNLLLVVVCSDDTGLMGAVYAAGDNEDSTMKACQSHFTGTFKGIDGPMYVSTTGAFAGLDAATRRTELVAALSALVERFRRTDTQIKQ